LKRAEKNEQFHHDAKSRNYRGFYIKAKKFLYSLFFNQEQVRHCPAQADDPAPISGIVMRRERSCFAI